MEVDVLPDPVDEASVDVEVFAEEDPVEEPLAATVLVEAFALSPDEVELPVEAVVFVEVLDDPESDVVVPVEAVVVGDGLAEPVSDVEEPVEAVVLVEVVADPELGEDEPPVEAVVLVDVLAEPDPPEEAVDVVEVEAVGVVVPVVAEVDGLLAAVDGLFDAEDDASVEADAEPVVFCVPDVFAVAVVPEAVGLLGTVHKVELKDDFALPEEFNAEADAGAVAVLGVEVAEVFEELCVLDAPPVMVG